MKKQAIRTLYEWTWTALVSFCTVLLFVDLVLIIKTYG